MTWDLLGHTWAVELLTEHIRRNSVRHAYLITGPRGIGRRTLALRFAQALNCTNPPVPGEACGKCRACQQIARQQHPDLSVVSSQQAGGAQILVEQVRELQRSLALAPYEARYRVALLLNFDEATTSTSNALLKTLEEPSPQVVLILTAESPERLLPTIVSRCEVLRLRPLPAETVSQGLQERWGLSSDQSRLLAHLSGGRPGYALYLAQDKARLDQRRHWLEDHQRLLAASRVERFAFSESHTKDKEQLRQILMVWLSLWRDVLLRASGSSAPLTNLDREDEIEALAAVLGLQVASNVISSVQRTLDMIDRNVNARLAMDVLTLDLPRTNSSSDR